jgi:hypothetical protein
MKPFGRYLTALLLLTALFSALSAGAVVVIDPIGYFGRRTERFFYPDGRRSKAALFRASDTRYAYFGSSLSYTFSPSAFPYAPLINAGDNGLMPEEILYQIERFGAGKQVVIIGIDPFSGMYDKPIETPAYAEYSLPNLVNNGLSLFMLRQAFATLAHEAMGHPPVMGRDGDRSAPWEGAATLTVREHRRAQSFDNEVYRTHVQVALSNWGDSVDRIPVYGRIAEALKHKNIKAVVFFQPLNQDILAGIAERPELQTTWLRFKARIREIFPNAVDLSDTPLSARENFYSFDSIHYNRDTASRVLAAAWTQALGEEIRR